MYFIPCFNELTLSCHPWNVGFYNNEGCMKKTKLAFAALMFAAAGVANATVVTVSMSGFAVLCRRPSQQPF